MRQTLDTMSVQKVETPSASYVLLRRSDPARYLIVVASWVMAFSLLLQPVFAEPLIGFNKTGEGPYDYNNTGNWVGGNINGIWDSSLYLTEAQTVYFGADAELGHGWTFNSPLSLGSCNLTLKGSGGDWTVTLGGNISMNNVPYGETGSEPVTIGSQTAGEKLNIDLGGATRTFRSFSGYGTRAYLHFENAITGSGGIAVEGSSTWVYLKGENTYTGATAVNASTLVLDYQFSNTSKLDNSAALILSGAYLQVGISGTPGTHVEEVGSTTIDAGASTIMCYPSGTERLNLKAITRNAGGTLRVHRLNSVVRTTSSNDATGILGAWAVRSTGSSSASEWATVSDGLIVNYTGYAALNTGDGSDTSNSRIQAGSVTLTGGRTTNSLKIEAGPSATSLELGANTLTLTSGGLLVSGAGAPTITDTTGDGKLTAGSSNELIVHQYNSAGLTISAVIGDNGNSVALTKSGYGPLILSGANTYSGQTYLNQGVLQVDGTLNGGGGAVNVKGFFEPPTAAFTTVLCGSGTINRPVVLTDGASILGGPSVETVGTLTLGSDLTLASGDTAWHRGGTVSVAGTTTINGTLSFGGTEGTLEIASGGTLKGTGIMGGGQSSVVIKSGATLHPGGSIGILAVGAYRDDLAQGLVHEGGSIFAWEARKYTNEADIGTAGTDYSQLVMKGVELGEFTLYSGTLGKLYFPAGEDFTGSFWNTDKTWDIITGGSNLSSGSIANGDISVFVNNTPYGSGNTITGQGAFSTVYEYGTLRLTWTPQAGAAPQGTIFVIR